MILPRSIAPIRVQATRAPADGVTVLIPVILHTRGATDRTTSPPETNVSHREVLMSNAANHATGRARGAQPQNRYVDLAPQHLHWSEPGRTKPVRRSADLSPAYAARLTPWRAGS